MLLKKLAGLNLNKQTVDWVMSYLKSRRQRVYANDVYSSYLSIVHGVPQGSVLGPLFYIIYANDLPEIFQNCHMAMYADDTVLYTANKNFGDSVNKMQKDLDSLAE